VVSDLIKAGNRGRIDRHQDPALSFRVFDIGNIRKIVKDKIREESNFLGNDDE
jgi:hypothetical protein